MHRAPAASALDQMSPGPHVYPTSSLALWTCQSQSCTVRNADPYHLGATRRKAQGHSKIWLSACPLGGTKFQARIRLESCYSAWNANLVPTFGPPGGSSFPRALSGRRPAASTDSARAGRPRFDRLADVLVGPKASRVRRRPVVPDVSRCQSQLGSPRCDLPATALPGLRVGSQSLSTSENSNRGRPQGFSRAGSQRHPEPPVAGRGCVHAHNGRTPLAGLRQ
jgi:hypothetical protein